MLNPSQIPDNNNNLLTGITGLERQARPYQRQDAQAAADILLTRPAVLLGHEPGLGKCLMCLLIMAHRNAQRVLIVGPAIGRSVWENEVERWMPSWADRLAIVRPGSRPPDLLSKLKDKNAIVVLSYDQFSHPAEATDRELDPIIFGHARFDLGIFDEAHHLKSTAATRTRRIYHANGVAKRCGSVVLLSGTPAPNGAHELYPHLAALWPDLIQIPSRHGPARTMTEQEWTDRVCKTRPSTFGPQIIGTQDVPLVRRVLKDIMIRRTKHDVLPELPPVIARDIGLDLDAQKTWAGFTPETRRLHTKIATRLIPKHDDATVLKQLRIPPNDPDAAPLATLRRQLAEAKLYPAVEWAALRLDADLNAKLVFFGWHVAVLERLHALMAQYNPVLLTGQTSDRDRKRVIEIFQKNSRCRVFVGQLAACGTAVTLTAGTECVFIECAWTPGLNTQAIGRLHRMGKKENVLATFLYAPGTIDELVMRVFRRKAEDIREFVEG